MPDEQDKTQARVEHALADLAERVDEANANRVDTRKADRAAAVAHQATVDEAIAKLQGRVARANAKRNDPKEQEKRRQAAIAQQRVVDDAVADLVADGRVLTR